MKECDLKKAIPEKAFIWISYFSSSFHTFSIFYARETADSTFLSDQEWTKAVWPKISDWLTLNLLGGEWNKLFQTHNSHIILHSSLCSLIDEREVVFASSNDHSLRLQTLAWIVDNSLEGCIWTHFSKSRSRFWKTEECFWHHNCTRFSVVAHHLPP